jgi:hypothetical protein
MFDNGMPARQFALFTTLGFLMLCALGLAALKQQVNPDHLPPLHLYHYIILPFQESKDHPYKPTNYSQITVSDNIDFSPGFLDKGGIVDQMPIRDYVSPSLRPACLLLERGYLSQAAPAFEQAISKGTTNPALYIAYIQASPDKWLTLLPQYEADVQKDPSALNEFKLGYLLYCITPLLDEDMTELTPHSGSLHVIDTLENQAAVAAAQKAAGIHLHHALLKAGPDYEKTAHRIIVDVCLSLDTNLYIRGIRYDSGKAVPLGAALDKFLHYAVGDKSFHLYLLAEHNKFYASVPAAPHTDRAHLLLTHDVLRRFISLYGFNLPAGDEEQHRGYKYFKEWLANVDRALQRTANNR